MTQTLKVIIYSFTSLTSESNLENKKKNPTNLNFNINCFLEFGQEVDISTTENMLIHVTVSG